MRAVHARVHGTAPDGRAYDATDPHLLEWVHLAEVNRPGFDGDIEDPEGS